MHLLQLHFPGILFERCLARTHKHVHNSIYDGGITWIARAAIHLGGPWSLFILDNPLKQKKINPDLVLLTLLPGPHEGLKATISNNWCKRGA